MKKKSQHGVLLLVQFQLGCRILEHFRYSIVAPNIAGRLAGGTIDRVVKLVLVRTRDGSDGVVRRIRSQGICLVYAGREEGILAWSGCATYSDAVIVEEDYGRGGVGPIKFFDRLPDWPWRITSGTCRLLVLHQ